MKKISFLVLILFTISACTYNDKPAPIIYNHKGSSNSSANIHQNEDIPLLDANGNIIEDENKLHRSEIIDPNDKSALTADEDLDENNFVLPNSSPVEDRKKTLYHEVQPGETIEDIAIQYEQSVEEIGRLNNLYPPYVVEKYQSLKIVVDSDFARSERFVHQTSKERHKQASSAGPKFIKPVTGKILSKFGQQTSYGKNKGINIAAKEGTKVEASATGKIIYADYDATFGNLVIIKLDGSNTVTAYAHLEDLIVNKGSSIKQGEVVGYVGSTGKVRESQLHFAIREGKIAVDPTKYVKY